MSTHSTKDDKDIIVVEGDIVDILPGLEYDVLIDFQGMQHHVKCYVSGKMRTHYIQLLKGDRVKVEISMYDIDKGRITYRITKRTVEQGPPRRPKK